MLLTLVLSLLACKGDDPKNDDTTAQTDDSVPLEDGDGDGYLSPEDCDDGDASIHPEADELCDDLDNDCDGETVEAPAEPTTFYEDTDGDGHGVTFHTERACSAPEGWATVGDDCDDGDAQRYPGANERCNREDDDCDGLIDEGSLDPVTWYYDGDGDGYGTTDSTIETCEPPADYVDNADDCDDTDRAIHPGASETVCSDPTDYNCDGTVGYTDGDGDGYAACEECDDADPAIHPGATEVCDDADNDCDGRTDDSDSDLDLSTANVYYTDGDGDGHGDPDASLQACEPPGGAVTLADDCDDSSAAVSPGNTEVCDGLDNDCEGSVDGPDAADAILWYADADGDGYGDPAFSRLSCEAPTSYVADASDCDDAHAEANPAGTEVCDGLDNDCEGTVDGTDAADILSVYPDADGDGFGVSTGVILSCTLPSGYSLMGDDCDDAHAEANPMGTEVCDGLDNDCEGSVDGADALDAVTWYADADSDGYGDPQTGELTCTQPSGAVTDNTDCDDAHADALPGGTEVCDGLDNDCDGSTDGPDSLDALTLYTDADGDSYGDPSTAQLLCAATSTTVADNTDCDDTNRNINPGVSEAWYDGVDADCSGGSDYDADGDGYEAESWGLDCDDTDASRFPGGNTWQVPGDFSTIQAALDYACALDRVEVAAGTWSEALSVSRSVELVGVDGSAATIVTHSVGPVLSVGAVGPTISGFTISGGAFADGAGLTATGSDGLLLQDIVVRDNVATGNGGGALCLNCVDVRIEDSTFAANGAGGYGGGLAFLGSSAGTCGTLVLSGVTFSDNYASGSGRGGGLYADCDVRNGNHTISATDVDLVGNVCDNQSAGAYFEASNLTWTGGDLSGNDGGIGADGGAIRLRNSTFTGSDLLFGENLASRGAGLYGVDSTITLSDSLFADNLADGGASAMYVTGSSTTLQNVDFLANWSDSGDGTVKLSGVGSTVSLRDLEFLDNGSANAGYFSLYIQGSGVLDNLLVVGNEDGGVYLYPDAVTTTLALTGATVVGNAGDGLTLRPTFVSQITVKDSVSAYNDGYGVLSTTTSYTPILRYNDVYGNLSGAYSGMSAATGSNGNIAVNPLFVAYSADLSPLRWDLHPGTGSPLINAGDSSVSDADGTRADIGFYGGLYGDQTWWDDSDGDGLPDGWESLYGLDITLDDSADDGDGDGLLSSDELAEGTDPLDADTDGDGVGDGQEILDGTDPLVVNHNSDADFHGPTSSDYLGRALCGLGDSDGDGQAEILVGAPGASAVYLLEAPFTTGTLAQTAAMARFSFSRAGSAIAVGEANGDGVNDVLLADPGSAGTVYLFHGPFSGTLTTANAARSLSGEGTGAASGTALAFVSDLDGDGLDELFVGAPGYDYRASNDGGAYLVLGSSSSGALGGASLRIYGETAGDALGSALADAGDLDGDGLHDLAVGAPGADPNGSGSGQVVVMYGPATGLVTSLTADALIQGPDASGDAGSAVWGAGDTNGDGYDDLLIGGPGLRDDSGAAWLVLGPIGATEELAAADATLLGEHVGDLAGYSVSSADADGDGAPDLLVGGYGHSSSRGMAWLVLSPVSGVVDLVDADRKVNGYAAADQLGEAVAGVGDLDGDGEEDWLVGAPNNDTPASNAGAAWLIYGGF